MHDNRALQAAIERGKSVIPLFISDPYLLESRYHASARGRKAFLFAGLRSLDAGLRDRGSRLTVREGNPHQVLTQVLGETGANVIVAEEDFSPYGIRRDGDVRKNLPLLLVPGASLRHPSDVVKRHGKPYTVFTPFSRAWKVLPHPAGNDLLPAPEKIGTTTKIFSVELPAAEVLPCFPAGEQEAHRRLSAFMSGPIPRPL